MNTAALFLKAPILGTVKTRLARAMGEEAALEAYQDLVEFLLNRIRTHSVHIHYAADDVDTMIHWLGTGYFYEQQVGFSLGERLIHAMKTEFENKTTRLLFLGGDCPYVNYERLTEAYAVLDSRDVVIGPAIDGGYYLIGVKENRPELFQQIDWGTERVLEQTLANCRKVGVSVALLPEESDVDDFESWQTAKAFIDAAHEDDRCRSAGGD
jgi:uncharacterized protein